jgi:pSer/pThr/pTyr-binding forkhead associated (FHA) protein
VAKLILAFNNQVIKEYPLARDSMTMGRQEDNSIVIDNLAVSAYHARIDKVGGEYVLTDLQSTNGTFVNDEKVMSHKLSHGDNVVIGKHVILFVATEVERLEAEEKEKRLPLDKTMLLDKSRHQPSKSLRRLE